MNVCWPVVIWINDYPEPINPIDCRHTLLYTKPKRLGIIIYANFIPHSTEFSGNVLSPS
jgi:hypothetical protein